MHFANYRVSSNLVGSTLCIIVCFSGNKMLLLLFNCTQIQQNNNKIQFSPPFQRLQGLSLRKMESRSYEASKTQ